MRSLIFLVALASVQAYFDCPPGYSSQYIYRNGANVRYCFRVYYNFWTRQQAVAQCSMDGATLATISSPEENQMYVSADALTGSLTFGLSCFDNSNCAFDDGTPYNVSSYNQFTGGSPDTSLGYCVALETLGSGAGRWSSVPCEMWGAFVCNYNPNSAVSQQSGCNSLYILDQQPVVITSPHYPLHYDNYQTCSYFLNGPGSSSYGLNITFTNFYTENNYDPVRVYNGGYRNNATLLGEYSGSKSQFTVLTTDYESLITFTSDGSGYYSGFSAVVNYYYKN